MLGMPLIFITFVPLTYVSAATIVERKHDQSKYSPMAETQLKILEGKIDELISLCNDLNRENQSLKADSANWHNERQSLVDKNDLARTKLEAMLGRLKAMEQQS
jgi:cell division protein ZapB